MVLFQKWNRYGPPCEQASSRSSIGFVLETPETAIERPLSVEVLQAFYGTPICAVRN
jgi:hypothetical protein